MNKCSWRFFSIFIITALLFSSMAGINLKLAFADVQNTQVTPYPREAGKIASYRIGANLNADLNAGTDSITVIFPKETRIDSMISSANISVNPRKLNGADFEIDYARGTINLFAPLQKGDRVTASYRYDPGVATTRLPRNVKFCDRTYDDARLGNGQLDPGEFVYEDQDNNNRVSIGDRRLTNVIAKEEFYPAGSIVGEADTDIELPLTSYPVSNLKFVDISNTGSYQPEQGDWLVDDRDNDGLLSTGDRIIIGQFWYMAGSTVGRHDLDRYLDETTSTETFYSDLIPSDRFYEPAVTHPIKDKFYHTENLPANGEYDQGEFIYKKTASGTLENRVQAGDTRLTAVMVDKSFYPRGSVVTSGDKDLNKNLVPFLAGDEPNKCEIFPVYPSATPRNFMDDFYPDLYRTQLFGSKDPDPDIIYERAQRLTHVHRALYQAGSKTDEDIDRDHTETLFKFDSKERYIDNGNDEFYIDAPIYRDLDGNGRVSENDVRLTPFSVYTADGHRIYYTAGSIVRKGEADYDQTLKSIPEDIRYADERGTGRFDPGDRIYEQDGTERTRLTPYGIVSANHTIPPNYPDAGLTLTRGWTEISNEVVINFADGGERQLQLNNRPIIRPVVAPVNDPNHRINTINIQGGDMRSKGKYWYTITAFDSEGGESAPWAERMVEFSSGAQMNATSIQWSPVENAAKYRIYRTDSQGTYTETALIAEVYAPFTHYIDLGGHALTGTPPLIYSSSFTNLMRTRVGSTKPLRLIEFELSDYKLDPITGTIVFRQPLQQLDTIVADYDRAVKVASENIVFQVIQGRGQLRHGHVLDPNIYGESLYPLRLHRISASNPNDPTLLVRGVDYEFEDRDNNNIEGLKKGEIKFYIQLKDSDVVRAEYSYRRQVRGDMIRVATGNETTVRTTEGNIVAGTDIIMKGRTLSAAPVINVMSSDKGPLVTFTTPVNITPNPANKINVTPDSPRDLNITFSLQIGIRNPETAGTYQVFMRTSKEQTETLSHPYEIIAGEEGQQLIKLTRDQQVEAGSSIALTTSVQDQLGNSVPNVNVTYSILRSPENMGRLDKTSFVTDSSGKTVAMLTTSPQPGENVIEARIAGTNMTVTFSITGLSTSPIQTIRLSPESAVLVPRGTRQFRASAYDGAGNVVPNIDFTWSVDPANLGTIDRSGNFSASDAIGSGMIYAEAYGVRGAATITIGSAPPDEIAIIQIDPTSATLAVNQSLLFKAFARDKNNQVVEGVSFNWTLTPADLGVISANGLFTASRKGTGVVIVSAHGKQAIAAVTVTDNISRIEINPSSATVKRNETVQFYAMVYDANNQIITAPVSWAVTGGIGIITQTGIFTATTAGNGQVTATAGGVTASVPVLVTDEGPGDTEGPSIDILYPSPNQTIAEDSIIVRGIVRDPSGVRSVMVNNVPANYDPATHNFTSQPLRLSAGANTITIVAEDTVGNQSQKTIEVVKTSAVIIKLAIGSSFAAVVRDGKTEIVRIDQNTTLSPFIQSGRTMVPLRFIAEAFGAEVKWHADPSGTGDGGIEIILIKSDGMRIVIKMHTTSKTVIIEKYAPGSFQAQTTRIEMEVKPFIVRPQGRTVVPIRFIAEAFGAEVHWDAPTQEITITLMP